jgi:hypothetical protein
MSTIKISELPKFNTINANTSNTLFVGVDIPSAQTFQFSAATVAAGLFANTELVVGNNRIFYDNTVAQFSGVANNYLQINFQNFSTGTKASSDFVVSTDDSDNTTKFVDLGISNGNYSDPANYSAFSGYDAYLYNYGPTLSGAQGNLIIGAASANAKTVFIAGGVMQQNIVAWMTTTGLKLNTQSYITFSDNTTQTTAGASNAYSQAAFALANTTVTNQAAINLTQNTSITAAFTKANNALANTTGTFAGDLTITGNVITSGLIDFTNTTFDPNIALVQITGANTSYPSSNANYMLHITGKANSVTRLVLDSFGVTTYPALIGRMGRGSSSSPVAVANNDIMMRIVGNGFTGTQFPSSSPTKIDFIASENFTDVARGTRIEFYNTPVGSNTIQQIASFNADSVSFAGVVNPAKGFIFTPRLPVGNQTAITIDYATDSMIKANLVADLTVSHTNFTTGKVVEMWLVNTSGFTRTITHGVTALNSTKNSTTFTIPSTAAAYLKYFSIDGDLANTFVTITNA